MRLRPIAGSELNLVLDWTVAEPVAWISAERCQEEYAARQFRPEWSWIAEQDGQVLARALWWGRAESAHPIALDCLSVRPDARPDAVALAAELLTAGHRAFGELGAPLLPEYVIRLPWDEADADAEARRAAAVAWRREAARRAGLTECNERLQFAWTPDAGVPAPASPRLSFDEDSNDEAFVEVFRRVARGSLDVQTNRSVASVGDEAAAREELRFYLSCPGKREWWRLARTPDGAVVGFAIPSATPYGPNVGYLGVVPELRGQGYVDDILAEITRLHAGQGAQRITATTDVVNTPMAAAFRRAGYRTTETRVVLEAPAEA